MDFLLFTLFAVLAIVTFKALEKLLNCNNDRLIAKYDFWAILIFLVTIVLAFVFGIRTLKPIIESLF